MIDKRTTLSQNQKQFLASTTAEAVISVWSSSTTLHSAIIFTNCWKLRIYICLHILQQFQQLAAHTTSTVAKYAVKLQTIKPTMIEQIPSTLQSSDSDCTFSTILVPSPNSTFCSAEVLHETISSLLDHESDQLELNLNQINSSWMVHFSNKISNTIAISWVEGKSRNLWPHNLLLAADNHRFAVANANLAFKSPVFKLRFHNSNSRLSQPSNNNGHSYLLCSCSKVSTRTSRPSAAAHTIIFT